MTGLIDNLALGFAVALSWQNLAWCFAGTLLGTLIGVLPGIGPVATIAILLPATFALEPTTALIMLAGIYYGAQYGGSTTAILINLPGEASSVVTVLDGHAMARAGRAGAALAVAALASLAAGCIATLLIALAAPLMSGIALSFGAAEYFSLMVLGLVAAMVIAAGSLLRAVGMILLGILLGLIGTDVTSGVERYTFGITELADGLDFVVLAMGIFGIGEIVASLRNPDRLRPGARITAAVGRLWPSRADFRAAWAPALRGTFLGSLLGVLPGGGAILASFSAYSLERQMARDPARFGQGAVEGVAAPEAANNAAAQTAFIPLLTLGIPPNAVLALMAGAMMIHGIAPGPNVLTDQPALVWGLIASMWIGNLMLVVLNLPLIGLWVRLLSVPYRLLAPSIVVFCAIGVYSLGSSALAVVLMGGFGLAGYVFGRLGCEVTPLLLGFVLGPMLEENLRRAMTLSLGDPTVLVSRPLSAALLAAAAGLLALVLLPNLAARRALLRDDG